LTVVSVMQQIIRKTAIELKTPVQQRQ